MDTYNIAAYGASEQLTGFHMLSFGFHTDPKINVGGSKLAARFTQLLLTRKGSDKTDPQAGCDLLSMIANFHTSEREYLRAEINTIIGDVSFQMRAENDPDVIPESRFVSAECKNIEIDNGVVHLFIVMMTAANTPIQFALPMSIV